jgi:hypothetical protein
MISDSSQKPLHMAANSDQSENSAAPRKPWKTPHMIVSETSDAEAGGAVAGDGGSAQS